MSTVDTSNNTSGSNSINDSTVAQRALDQNYETFLKLLTTQLQNQDPTQPADTNQLTQQIASLSSVEQQIATNKKLESLLEMYSTSQINSTVSYLGAQIDAEGDKGVLKNNQALFVYNLPAGAVTADVTIKNAAGQTVFTGPGTTLAGRNPVVWDGKDSVTNTDSPEGIYTISVAAKDGAGNELDVTTLTSGIVTAIDSKNGVTSLSLGGDLSIPLSSVQSVRVPGA